MSLLGPDGRPIGGQFTDKKDKPKLLGGSFGHWAGQDMQYATMPGGGVVQFDLSKLTLRDYRAMRDHYQVNASLAVLTFMQHQSQFHVECEDQRIADFCNEQLHNVWTLLNKAMSTANWAGFSPNVIEWDNDYNSRAVVISAVKDLVPEDCAVNWETYEGWAPEGLTPPKYKKYNGIKQIGLPWPIPAENTFWFSLLMENGDYYGRKLLRPGFQSWFFSILLHLFANRYYERFGEPTPIGRAPFDETFEVDGQDVQGNDYMMSILQRLRSRGTVVLPNSRSQMTTGSFEYDYDIEYLEAQMRGADFERYMTRLDEEISLSMFTPILILRTADVGSYNLGKEHMKSYLWMLNSMNSDRKLYIDEYILKPMVNFNFSSKAPRARIVFQNLGSAAGDMLQDILVTLINKDKATVDLEQIGSMAGLTVKEVRETLEKPKEPATDPAADPAAPPEPNGDAKENIRLEEVRATGKEISTRVRGQIESAFREGRFNENLSVNMGYKRKFEKALQAHGISNPIDASNTVYKRMDNWLKDVTSLGQSEFSGPDSFMNLFDRVLDNEIASI